MKYAVVTFGCRVNQADSLGFEEELLAVGRAVGSSPETADLVIVNTCSVTATADQGARQTIRRIAREQPRREDRRHRLLRDAEAGRSRRAAQRRARRPQRRQAAADRSLLRRADRDADHAERSAASADDGPCGATIEPGVAGRTAFTLRVQTGCAEPCSYCIIPTTRGLPRSVPIDDVLREVERVAAAGFKEIALTGVHLGSYGRDLTPRSSLIELLRAIDESTGPTNAAASAQGVLFRISSLEPMDCSREIVDLVVASDRFAPHFHLPLQHASNRMLAAMRRPYTIEYYASLVDDIRARIPHASIGSDIIVGFPGETDEDFEQLVGVSRALAADAHLHVFPYSDRPGTAGVADGGTRCIGERRSASAAAASARSASDWRRGSATRRSGRCIAR